MKIFSARAALAAEALHARPSDWSSQEIALVRRMIVAGDGLPAIAAALGGTLSPQTVRYRCKKLGLRMNGRGRVHNGFPTKISTGEGKFSTSEPHR